MKNNKGISLIVLIITIVIIIILATAIIVNLAQTNIINNANEAVVKQDFKTMQEELNLYIADEYANTRGTLDVTTIDANTTDEVKEILKSSSKSKYIEYVTIVDGKIVISEDAPSDIKEWANEAISQGVTTPDQTKTPVIAVNTIVTTANATVTGEDFAYSNPVIPVGFKAIETTDATWVDADNDGTPDGWNNGLVIQDENENEFVWVPVDGTNVTYTKNFTYPSYYSATEENTSDDTAALPIINETTVDETEQITKYGGFYIGRYEAGVPEAQTTIDGASSTTSDTTGIPIVKQGATVWTYISYTNANTNALAFCNTDNVKSGIVTGTAWDTVCAWIQSETDSDGNVIHDVTNSTSWGNYNNTTGNAQYDTDGTTKISGSKQTAGYSEYWKAKNIYDIAGNTSEWTGEIYSSYRIRRGSNYNNLGSTYPASYRGRNNPSDTNVNVSFRIVLYVM